MQNILLVVVELYVFTAVKGLFYIWTVYLLSASTFKPNGSLSSTDENHKRKKNYKYWKVKVISLKPTSDPKVCHLVNQAHLSTFTFTQLSTANVCFTEQILLAAKLNAGCKTDNYIFMYTVKNSQPRDVKTELTWILTALQYEVCKNIVFQHDTCRLDSLNWRPQLIATATKTNRKTSLTNIKLFVKHRKSTKLTWHHDFLSLFSITTQIIMATTSVLLTHGLCLGDGKKVS